MSKLLTQIFLIVTLASISLNVIQFFLRKNHISLVLSQFQFLSYVHEGILYQVTLYYRHKKNPKYREIGNILSKASTISGLARAGKYEVEAISKMYLSFQMDKRIRKSHNSIQPSQQ